MDAEINNVIYMELNSGPKIANSTCGKTIDFETIDRDSTVHVCLHHSRPVCNSTNCAQLHPPSPILSVWCNVIIL